MAQEKTCRVLSVIVTLITVYVSSVYCGECCNNYQDITGTTHPAQWCSDFCCYDKNTLGFTLSCCENDYLRAPEEYRDSFCIAWWASHVYVPILVAAAIVIGIITCCCCCCCGCCCRRNRGVLVQTQGQGGPGTIVVQQQQQQMSAVDPYRVGYNQ